MPRSTASAASCYIDDSMTELIRHACSRAISTPGELAIVREIIDGDDVGDDFDTAIFSDAAQSSRTIDSHRAQRSLDNRRDNSDRSR